MALTVATTRDMDGNVSTREVYADAAGYRLQDSDLLVLGAGGVLLAVYPSGNWTSVALDPDDAAPAAGGRPAAAPPVEAVAAAAPRPARTGEPGSHPGVPAPDAAAGSSPGAGPDRTSRAGFPDHLAHLRPVVFAPRTGPRWPARPSPEQLADADRRSARDRMRKVRFGPIAGRPQTPVEPVEPSGPAFQPVTFTFGRRRDTREPNLDPDLDPDLERALDAYPDDDAPA